MPIDHHRRDRLVVRVFGDPARRVVPAMSYKGRKHYLEYPPDRVRVRGPGERIDPTTRDPRKMHKGGRPPVDTLYFGLRLSGPLYRAMHEAAQRNQVSVAELARRALQKVYGDLVRERHHVDPRVLR